MKKAGKFVLWGWVLKLCIVSFYVGWKSASEGGAAIPGGCAPTDFSDALRQRIDERVKEELAGQKAGRRQEEETYADAIFPRGARDFASGALRVSRDEMLATYDFGVPIKPITTETDAIILYNTPKALPSSGKLKQAAMSGQSNEVAKASVRDAMENCDAMNVVFTSPNNMRECHLVIGGFESYHINRWMRMPDFATADRKHRQLDRSLPLRHVGRIVKAQGVDEFDLPDVWRNFKRRERGFVLEHFDRFRVFLENKDRVLKDLKKLLADRNVVRENTVVVLTVNAGQSELLSNFICAARSRGLDTGNILVFPTDEVSYKLAQGLGVATYYDEKNLGALPHGEAKAYGDPIFASMMFAKVLCVLYVSLLGHDVLFQDVDIVWYKDPLLYFHDKSNTEIQKFDIMFQHDGSAQARYNPWSANSGFYYVRANKKAQYLFASLLYHGAVVRKSKSHQQVLVQLINEHVSMFGLNVKVFDKLKTDMFPGGYHYHQDWTTMRKIVEGKSNAYLLHMSWTENKVNKLLFFRQMGEWYVKDQCIGSDAANLMGGGDTVADGSLVEQCCSVEPIFSCHFSDKPSKHSCRDSPKIDPHKGGSFWK